MDEVWVSGVRRLGSGVPYLDGAEDRLYSVISAASDRSSRSDELAYHITDWPSRYHLSRLRPNLLMPFALGSEHRVLDVGCGTGALTRELAERGCQVTGLEGSLQRARCAAARTTGLSNCEIVSGSLSEYVAEGHSGEFDVVLLCGVLEYSAHSFGGLGGPAEMLAQARQLLKPSGVVVLAIENQIGLKYLLGYPEDHRGLPWVGVGGYRSGANPAHTWPRPRLAAMLSESGLTSQEWLFPYPDYKLPTVIARAALFGNSEGRGLVRQFIRSPVVDSSATTMLTIDPPSAFRVMLEAGLGPDTANSFLVVAGTQDAEPAALISEGMLWLSSSERNSEFMDLRVVQASDGDWELVPRSHRAQVHRPPLHSHRSNAPVVLGSNLEDELVEQASRASSPEGLNPLLQEWWDAARHAARNESGTHTHFDVMPRNFIRSSSGELAFIDKEWTWTDPVPDSWLLLRALWYLVIERLWPAGALAGLSWQLTVGEAATALATVVLPTLGPHDQDVAVALEAELQTLVAGGDVDERRAQFAQLMQRPLTTLTEQPALVHIIERPVAFERRVHQVEAEIQQVRAEKVEVERQLAQLRAKRLHARLRRLGGKVKRRLSA